MPRIRLRTEDGSALVVSFAILLTVMIFSAATWQAAVVLTNRSNTDTDAQQAFQAADAGIDAAVHRLSQYSGSTTAPLTAGQNMCITTTPVSLGAPGWCAATAAESVDTRASFSYRVSTDTNVACIGSAVTTGDRCIVSTGTVNGVRRRLIARVFTQGGTNSNALWNGGTQATDSVKVESNATLTSDVKVNNKLEVNHGSTISGSVVVSKGAKVKGWANYGCSPADCSKLAVPGLSAPDFRRTPWHYNATTEPNGNNNLSIASAYYTPGTITGSLPPATRKLYIPKNRQVTLGPGIYNFCTIQIDGRGILNAVGTSANPVIIYLDSPFRPGSNCPKDSGVIKSSGKSAITNPSLDPTALNIIAWGSTSRKKRARLQVPMGKNGTLAAIIYAPNSEVRFSDNKGVLIGGIGARRIVFKKNMRYIQDTNRVTSWTTATVQQTYRAAWKQCNSNIANPSPPNSGC